MLYRRLSYRPKGEKSITIPLQSPFQLNHDIVHYIILIIPSSHHLAFLDNNSNPTIRNPHSSPTNTILPLKYTFCHQLTSYKPLKSHYKPLELAQLFREILKNPGFFTNFPQI